jgi:predicted ATPase
VEQPREAVEEVDVIRLEYFAGLFKQEGFDNETAQKRAYLAYCLMMGDSILHNTLKSVSADDFVGEAIEVLSTSPDDKS